MEIQQDSGRTLVGWVSDNMERLGALAIGAGLTLTAGYELYYIGKAADQGHTGQGARLVRIGRDEVPRDPSPLEELTAPRFHASPSR